MVLISVGLLLLLHNYGHLDLTRLFVHWWPVLFIFWGIVKLWERTMGRRAGTSSGAAITAGEVFLVVGMLALLAIVVGVDYTKEKVEGLGIDVDEGEGYTFDIDVPPQKIPENARVMVHVGRGDVNARVSDESELRVTGKKTIHGWSESGANHEEKSIDVSITKNGDSYEVQPKGYDLGNQKIAVDLEMSVPKKSPLSIKTDRGDVQTADIGGDVNISDGNGDVESRGTHGDVSIDMRKGDVKVADTKGDVKISGKGGEIEVVDSAGGLTVDGDFYGPVRADKVPKGVRLLTLKTDLTTSAVAGHIEARSGSLEMVDIPGNIQLRTRDSEINLENPGAKVNIDDRNAEINVRYSFPPRDDATINNSSAAISLTLPGSSSFEIQADCHNCDIDSDFPGLSAGKSEAGDSHLAAKYGSGRGPKIVLKTSYGNISLRRTSVSMPAPPTPSTKPPKTPRPPQDVPPSEEE